MLISSYWDTDRIASAVHRLQQTWVELSMLSLHLFDNTAFLILLSIISNVLNCWYH